MNKWSLIILTLVLFGCGANMEPSQDYAKSESKEVANSAFSEKEVFEREAILKIIELQNIANQTQEAKSKSLKDTLASILFREIQNENHIQYLNKSKPVLIEQSKTEDIHSALFNIEDKQRGENLRLRVNGILKTDTIYGSLVNHWDINIEKIEVIETSRVNP